MSTQTTHAIVATAYGGPEVLDLVAVDVPSPGPGEVAVDVRAAGVNPYDVKVYAGLFGTDPAKLPMRLGSEGAGVVAGVGPDVDGVAIGDEVICFPAGGTYAERIVVPVTGLTPKPADLAWEQAAGLMLTGAAAVHALTAARVGEGDTVLIHNGAGGVGQMALQLAVARGATVIATAAPAHHDLVRELGGIPVTFGDGLLERARDAAPTGVTAALDLIGTDEAMDVSLALVGDRDRIATIANFDRGPREGVKVLGAGGDPGTDVRNAARTELAALAGAGKLRVRVDRTFPLAETADAHRYVATGSASGKVVLLP